MERLTDLHRTLDLGLSTPSEHPWRGLAEMQRASGRLEPLEPPDGTKEMGQKNCQKIIGLCPRLPTTMDLK